VYHVHAYKDSPVVLAMAEPISATLWAVPSSITSPHLCEGIWSLKHPLTSGVFVSLGGREPYGP